METLNPKRYLNYAVYTGGSKNCLVIVTSGYFASDAWMKGDTEYNDVLGSKFGGIFGDTGKEECCNKSNIRRLISDEEFENLLTTAHPALKMNVKLKEFLDRAVGLGILSKRLAGLIWYREARWMYDTIEKLPGVKISYIVRQCRKVYASED